MANELELETVNFYMLDDILSYFTEEFAADFYDNFLTDVSWGDAVMTLVDGGRIAELLASCWDEGNYGTEEEKEALFDQLSDLEGELVALRG